MNDACLVTGRSALCQQHPNRLDTVMKTSCSAVPHADQVAGLRRPGHVSIGHNQCGHAPPQRPARPSSARPGWPRRGCPAPHSAAAAGSAHPSSPQGRPRPAAGAAPRSCPPSSPATARCCWSSRHAAAGHAGARRCTLRGGRGTVGTRRPARRRRTRVRMAAGLARRRARCSRYADASSMFVTTSPLTSTNVFFTRSFWSSERNASPADEHTVASSTTTCPARRAALAQASHTGRCSSVGSASALAQRRSSVSASRPASGAPALAPHAHSRTRQSAGWTSETTGRTALSASGDASEWGAHLCNA